MSETTEDTPSPQPKRKYPLVTIRGLLLPEPFLVPSIVEEVMDFKPCDSDIFIVTYPKCGTTWMQFIVWEILNKGAVPPSPNQMMFNHLPFLEFTGLEPVKKLSHPRAMKTHFPFHLQPYNPLSKYIYVVRNPWDCCVSYFHHHKNDPTMPQLTFDEYFEEFITGNVAWGDYFDHVLSWFKHKNEPNILFLTYEGLKKDTRGSFLRIAQFLGDSYYRDLQNEEILEKCLKHSDFKYLKKMGMFFPLPDLNASQDAIKEAMELIGSVDRETAEANKFREVNFFRKGVIGDWKNYFSEEQIEKFNEYMSRKLKNTDMENFWPPLLGETSF